ncbi:MAG: class I SAM-dependent methyltransferase [Candidatus Curtissbacteria bacterium]|nr:class I SAM-dependent methyltransferase [Candidatus Curtissbacteria bacterium]
MNKHSFSSNKHSFSSNKHGFSSNKHFLFYDTYERHKKIGGLIKNGETVLDVGGAANHLSQFAKPRKIITANLSGGENSDVIIKGDKLPFKNNSFDVVCSIDVLEHLPKNDRAKFIKELKRVAAKRIILSFPIQTPQHEAYERQTQEWLQSKGKDVTYLKEHIKFGLPEKDEILNITKGQKTAMIYSGNTNVNKFLFMLFIFDPRLKFIRKLTYCAKLVFNLVTNRLFYEILSNKKFRKSVNRAYLIIEK